MATVTFHSGEVQLVVDVTGSRPGPTVLPGQFQIVDHPDVLIVEGLNILQAGDRQARPSQHLFASDFFDFTMYVDAELSHIRQWYIERFFALRKTAFQDPSSHFHRYAGSHRRRS